jgi:DNA-directed RNA polymerase subunit RPC12/RpoP
MRQKLITLCPNSFELAQKKPNFSQWVRNKLLEEGGSIEKEALMHRYKCPLCTREELDVIRRARNCNKCDYAMLFKGQVIV